MLNIFNKFIFRDKEDFEDNVTIINPTHFEFKGYGGKIPDKFPTVLYPETFDAHFLPEWKNKSLKDFKHELLIEVTTITTRMDKVREALNFIFDIEKDNSHLL